MKRFLLFPALLFVLSSALVTGQGEIQQRSETYPGTNPYLGKKESINNGMTLYRWRCGECHALDGKYTAFARVVSGLEIARAMENVALDGERPKDPILILRVKIEKR